MNRDGYADITEAEGIQIALVHKILDENPAPHYVEDGWECWSFGDKREVKKDPIRIVEKPKFRRKYK
jgi:hypothetical protein